METNSSSSAAGGEAAKTESERIDQLLQSGQISNAIEFYNYFRNRSASSLNSSSVVAGGGDGAQVAAVSSSSGPVNTASSSSSSISTVGSLTGHGPTTGVMTGGGTPTQPCPGGPQPPVKRNKKSKTNTLSDYANILQNNPAVQASQSTSRATTGLGCKSKKSHLHSSSSSLTIYNTSTSSNTTNNSAKMNNKPTSFATANMLPTISIPSNLFSISSASGHKGSTQNINSIPGGGGVGGRALRPYSVYSFMHLPSQIGSSRSPTQSQTTIFNQYLISGAEGDQTKAKNSKQPAADVESPTITDENGPSDTVPSSKSPTDSSLSAVFLNSTSYYQKYKQNQQKKQQQQQQQQQSQPLANTTNLNQIGSSLNSIEDDWEMEKRKEDAVNRIIRNEKIKQIRLKIYECELLKEYQNFTPATNLAGGGFDSQSQQQETTQDTSSSRTRKKTAQSTSKINNYFSRTYGSQTQAATSASNTGALDVVYNISNPKQRIFDEYKSGSGDETGAVDPEPDLSSVDDELFQLNNEENYESGIEDDENSSTSSSFYFTTSVRKVPSPKSTKPTSNKTQQSRKNNKSSGATYDLYRLGGGSSGGGGDTSTECISASSSGSTIAGSSSNPNLFINLSSAAQSTFQLKISIISAEVKNIVNVLKQAELEVSALQRRVQLIEEDLEKTEERLNQATTKLNEASQAADESERQRKSLEARSLTDDERIATLEKQLNEAQIIAEDADRRYDEVSRRLAIMEVDLERAEDRAEAAEAKILELEEELKVVGNNMKSLEVSEQEAIQREESYEEQIRDLSARLKDAEQRADLAERTMAKLQKEVDRLEDELLAEKEKYKNISEELDQTLNELQGY